MLQIKKKKKKHFQMHHFNSFGVVFSAKLVEVVCTSFDVPSTENRLENIKMWVKKCDSAEGGRVFRTSESHVFDLSLVDSVI